MPQEFGATHAQPRNSAANVPKEFGAVPRQPMGGPAAAPSAAGEPLVNIARPGKGNARYEVPQSQAAPTAAESVRPAVIPSNDPFAAALPSAPQVGAPQPITVPPKQGGRPPQGYNPLAEPVKDWGTQSKQRVAPAPKAYDPLAEPVKTWGTQVDPNHVPATVDWTPKSTPRTKRPAPAAGAPVGTPPAGPAAGAPVGTPPAGPAVGAAEAAAAAPGPGLSGMQLGRGALVLGGLGAGTYGIGKHQGEKDKKMQRNIAFGSGLAAGVAAPHALRGMTNYVNRLGQPAFDQGYGQGY